MAPLRDLAIAVGTLGCAYGLAVLAVPTVAVPVPLSTPVVALVGLLAFVGCGLWFRHRLGRSRPLPDPPGLAGYPSPGDGWRERIEATGVADVAARRALREDLADAAVAALTATGTPPETARERLADGTWTSDPLAAAYVRDDPPTLAERLRALLSGSAPFQRRARRTMAAVADLQGADP